MTIEAVLFDFGGVVLASPFDAFVEYETRHGLPGGFLRQINQVDPDTNAWACLERGEISEAEFYERFEREARALGFVLDARSLMARLSGRIHEEMVDEIKRLKTSYRVSCLTNNMPLGLGTAMAQTPEAAARIAEVMTLFDHVIESRVIRMRKPEPRFFARACEIMQVKPESCVFLDDLGINLKPARALGMRTLKVTSPAQAISDLRVLLDAETRVVRSGS